MTNFGFSRSLRVAASVCALLLCGVAVHAQQYDGAQPYDQPAPAAAEQSPGRVARLAYLTGQVQFAPAGETDWGSVEVNRPMVVGDRLLTGDDGLAVLELGDASVRIDNDTAFDFLNLDSNNVQVELSQGTLNMAVRQMAQGDNFEVDTPTVAFVAATPGIYRIDDDPSGTGTMVTVFQGSGTVYGENGVSRTVQAGTSYRFNDSALASVDATGLPPPDNFDRFCEARDASYQRYAQQPQYVPPDMIGGEDLDQYGEWNDVPEYGNVWYPDSVPAGWAPYRYGHWAWIDPWGWTWVGDEPWGFAPFHYGRWAYVRDRWGWIPGPVAVQPVYAPALVAFIGGSGFNVALNLGGGGPVGWFPLGPRDVYVPWFHASRRYFTNVNVTNIRNVYVNRTVINNFYNDYHAGRRVPYGRNDYAYRDMRRAVTVVPRNVFTGARPVHSAVLRLDRAQLARSKVATHPGVNPGRASLGLRRPMSRPSVLHNAQPFTRPIVARRQPAPRPVAFAAREKLISRQHGAPVSTAQMQSLRRARPQPARNDRVKLVPALAAGAAGAAALEAARRGAPAGEAPGRFSSQTHPIPARVQPRQPVEAPRQAGSGTPMNGRFRNQIHPIPAREQPQQRPGELPSARFAHPERSATLPRAPVLRSTREPQRTVPQGRLPTVQRVERAPQFAVDRAAQQRQQQAQMQNETRAREQAAQQQRTQQQQRSMQMEEQRAQQQRAAQMQNEMRAREQAAQQQRMQQRRSLQAEQQRAQQQQRAMQAQEQRRAEMQRARPTYQRPAYQRPVERAPQRSGRSEAEHRAPPRKHPESSGDHH